MRDYSKFYRGWRHEWYLTQHKINPRVVQITVWLSQCVSIMKRLISYNYFLLKQRTEHVINNFHLHTVIIMILISSPLILVEGG